MKITYPNKLNKIFDKLKKNNIKPIIVGGYVRDFLLGINSSDIDIEIYGLNSFEKLEGILKEFGDVNSVGKSFGVCKLIYEELDLDFSLPRLDSKVATGHRGFEIQIDTTLNFSSAAKRRDFTINSIGYDIFEEKILDPFHGVFDLQVKVLRAVDKHTFVEDPLRVLRLVQFCARFEMSVDKELLSISKAMVTTKEFNELPKERIYTELKKLFLKSSKPSLGINILHDLGLHKEWQALLEVDTLALLLKKTTPTVQKITEREALILFFSLLYEETTVCKLTHITSDTKLLNGVETFIKYSTYLPYSLDKVTDYQLYFLATKIKLHLFFIFLDAKTVHKNYQQIDLLQHRAEELNILDKPLPALLGGRDLLEFGLQPSKEFKAVLDAAYEAQMQRKFFSRDKALVWLREQLCDRG